MVKSGVKWYISGIRWENYPTGKIRLKIK